MAYTPGCEMTQNEHYLKFSARDFGDLPANPVYGSKAGICYV